MASEALKAFLSSINIEYLQYADAIHHGTFTTPLEIGAAKREDLEALQVPKGAAGAIVAAAKNTGSSLCLVY